MPDSGVARPAWRRPASPAPVALVGAAGLAAALAVLVLAMGTGGTAPPSAGAGAAAGWGLPAARFALDLGLVATVGGLVFATAVMPAQAGRLAGPARRATRTAGWTAAGWAAAALLCAAFTAAEVTGRPLRSALAPAAYVDFLTGVSQGRALATAAGLSLLLAVCAPRVTTARDAGLLLVLAAAAALPPTLTGHTTETTSHDLATATLGLHVLAASAWVGGLAAVLVHGRAAQVRVAAATGFSALALWCALAVGVSGTVNAWIRLGEGTQAVGQLFSSRYGWLVLGKLGAFAALLAAGGWHRAHTLPQLVAGNSAALRRLAAVELLVMGCAIALAVGLSRTPPPTPDAPPGSAPAAQSTTAVPDGGVSDGPGGAPARGPGAG